ncbi:MAG TPA: bifunctional nuclease family protein [Gemmatimonadales bacterium]|jgi:bifunctional DNase/RNase|nr:bifunctional nuclease family protein [Gemmatimonadales bacterium]
MREVRVAHLGLDRTTNAPVVILREVEGGRILPIWIGPAEASAIAMEMQGLKAPRPMTHDLLKQVVTGLGAELRRLVIAEVRDNTYYAELHLARGGDDRFVIDSRPSDGIALALRLHAPIFAADGLLTEAVLDPDAPPPPTPPGIDAEQLKRYLETLDPEDFGKFNP